jgi:NAD(P)-dependent dehydrogenase (short-subunit alcohol dehydrogenase family)
MQPLLTGPAASVRERRGHGQARRQGRAGHRTGAQYRPCDCAGLAGEGADVVVNARSNQQEAEAVAREARDLGVKAVPILADVGKKTEVETPAAMALSGPLYLTRVLIEPIVRDHYGRILFFVGDGSISARGSGRIHLSAAKIGLIGMARGLASEFAPHNIRVNVVSPGSIDTRRDNPEWYQGHLPNGAGIPLGRQGSVDEIAATCLFRVSEDAGFITGQTIHVNGGAHY